MQVLLVDDRHERVCLLQETLAADGHRVTGNVAVEDDVLAAVVTQQPDVIVVDLQNPSRKGLEKIAEVNRQLPRPIVMFTADGSKQSIHKAVEAGISAYVVDGLNEQRLNPILEVALARFQQMQGLEDELAKTKQTLNERKVIDRAKGLLMKKRGMSEDKAYKAIRSMAMEQNQKMIEVANNLIAAAKLLG